MIKLGIVSTIVIFGISNVINTLNIDFRFKTDINISNLSGGATGTSILGCFLLW
ncbi:hypothetical protein P700755_000376 [Psychroflexus torquis ATCC 700755]|uniref:Uncharacterized protein n=1 Tax=Psychroflexus torquis (strain ATCC 700755 / CIP 106069 / ACAM 623) TaxID=313595 RepID=K4IBW5_PSYTT|nr:hypothetical protein P700755_000376 [Psychroflexus torquis ATCC 700755]